ncbi:hypothetical protein [Nocardia sp. NPDC052566]|uniref:hypothetical protein n=1 Tax=Nocardia sp. NPDC052566 TaxID=3364330 RepID=UPI0037C76032
MKSPIAAGVSTAEQLPPTVFIIGAAGLAALLATVIAVIGLAAAHPDASRRRAAQYTLRIITDMIVALFR